MFGTAPTTIERGEENLPRIDPDDRTTRRPPGDPAGVVGAVQIGGEA